MGHEPLPFTVDDGIIVLTLEQDAPVIVLNEALIGRLDAALDALPSDARGLVLRSGSERVFVAGADLKAIHAMDDAELHRYLESGARVFGRLSQLPYPTAAAINGAALGGGLELAMHCDALIAAPAANGKPYPVGLPEAGLSICPGWGGTNLLPARMDPGRAIAMTAEGKPMPFPDAVDAGLFDAVADEAGALVDRAKAWVGEADQPGTTGRDGAPSRCVSRVGYRSRTLTALDALRESLPTTEAAAAVAACVDIGLSGGWEQALQRERDHLVRLRNTEAGRSAIEGFLHRGK